MGISCKWELQDSRHAGALAPKASIGCDFKLTDSKGSGSLSSGASVGGQADITSNNRKGAAAARASVGGEAEVSVYRYRNLTASAEIHGAVEIYGADGILKWAPDPEWLDPDD